MYGQADSYNLVKETMAETKEKTCVCERPDRAQSLQHVVGHRGMVCQYRSSRNMHFSLPVVVHTPTHSNSPYFATIFSKTAPNSWVDMVVRHTEEKSQHSNSSKFFGLPHLTNAYLMNKSETKVPGIFSSCLFIHNDNKQQLQEAEPCLLDLKVTTTPHQEGLGRGHWTFSFILHYAKPSYSVHMPNMEEVVIVSHCRWPYHAKVSWLFDQISNDWYTHSRECNIELNASVTFSKGRYENDPCCVSLLGRRGPQFQMKDKQLCALKIPTKTMHKSVLCHKFTLHTNNTDKISFCLFNFEVGMGACASSLHSQYWVGDLQGILSWDVAAKVCKSTEGHLPVLHSKDDLLELTKLIKMSTREFSLIWLVYIGLRLTAEVGNFLNCRLP